MQLLRIAFCLCFLILAWSLNVSIARGSEIDDNAALSLFAPDETLVTTSRIPRPISRIAENVTVVTSEQIAALNAHTLADVLNTVPGIQLEGVQTPGNFTVVSLQGASEADGHILVMVDGIIQNNLLQGISQVNLIPVQQIERVEIVKGAASAAWGQALGGVINVVTKSPAPDKPVSGALFSSYGESSTSDLHAEATGTLKRFGYYLSGGNLHSEGLLPNNAVNSNDFYGKVTYDLPNGGLLTAGGHYSDSFHGLDQTDSYHDNFGYTDNYAFLSLAYPLTNRLSLEFMAQERRLQQETLFGHFDMEGVVLDNRFLLRESTEGGSAKLFWGDSNDNLVAGVEYEHGQTRQWDALVPDSPFLTDRSGNRWSGYANSAFSFGRFTILPGIRYDHTVFDNSQTSYTVGATCRLTSGTVLRSYFARGYGLANAIWDTGQQKVKTIQAGVETSDIPYLWLKATFFYNNTWNVQVVDADLNSPGVTLRSQIKQGFELEWNTVPFWNASLGGGYTFIDARDKESSNRLSNVPEHGLKLSLKYDDRSLGYKGVLTGNYVRWNAEPDFNGKYNNFLWDLSVTKKLSLWKAFSPELFLSVHNIFNASQYLQGLYKNAGRWFEGGARFTF